MAGSFPREHAIAAGSLAGAFSPPFGRWGAEMFGLEAAEWPAAEKGPVFLLFRLKTTREKQVALIF